MRGEEHPGGRAALLVAVTVLLALAAIVLLVAGVQVRETTGGLLVTPIRQLHLVGGALLGGTAAGVAAVLTSLAAVPAVRRARAARRAPAVPDPDEASPAGEEPPAPVEDDAPGDPAAASVSPASEHRA